MNIEPDYTIVLNDKEIAQVIEVNDDGIYAIQFGEGAHRQQYGFPRAVIDHVEGTTVYLNRFVDLADYEVGS